MSTALEALGAPEGRFEPKMARFLAERASAYARIAAISGRMPMMFMMEWMPPPDGIAAGAKLTANSPKTDINLA
jgi:hypothetical protein